MPVTTQSLLKTVGIPAAVINHLAHNPAHRMLLCQNPTLDPDGFAALARFCGDVTALNYSNHRALADPDIRAAVIDAIYQSAAVNSTSPKYGLDRVYRLPGVEFTDHELRQAAAAGSDEAVRRVMTDTDAAGLVLDTDILMSARLAYRIDWILYASRVPEAQAAAVWRFDSESTPNSMFARLASRFSDLAARHDTGGAASTLVDPAPPEDRPPPAWKTTAVIEDEPHPNAWLDSSEATRGTIGDMTSSEVGAWLRELLGDDGPAWEMFLTLLGTASENRTIDELAAASAYLETAGRTRT